MNFHHLSNTSLLDCTPMTPLIYPCHKTPSLVQQSGTYLLCRPSYSQFCVQIPKFLLPWQQVVAHRQLLVSQLNWTAGFSNSWSKMEVAAQDRAGWRRQVAYVPLGIISRSHVKLLSSSSPWACRTDCNDTPHHNNITNETATSTTILIQSFGPVKHYTRNLRGLSPSQAHARLHP